MKKIFFLTLAILLITIVSAQEFYPTTVSELKTLVTIGGEGTIEGLKANEEVKFQTLTFQESPYQTIISLNEKLEINGKTLKPNHTFDEYGNKYANFVIQENGDFNYIISAQIETKSLIFKIEDYNIEEPKESLQLYIKRSEKIESDSTEILTLTKNKLYKEGYIETINDAIFWVNDYVEYPQTGSPSYDIYYNTQRSAIQTLIDKKGVCDEFANLAAAMIRAKKIPTRINIGITFDGQEWGNHAWIGTYHEKAGWIASDPTFRESGFVDATHIKIGSFADVTESLAKAIYPQTTNVIFRPKNKPDVEVLDKKYFNEISIESDSTEIKTNQWNEIKVKIKNLTDGTLTIPVKLRVNKSTTTDISILGCTSDNQCIFVQDEKQSLILSKNGEGELTFKLYPEIKLEKNEYIQTKIYFNSLSPVFEKEIKIIPSEKKDNGLVTVKDITPIATTDQIIIETKIANYKNEKTIIDFNVTDTNNNFFWKEEINGFSEKTFEKILSLNNEGYKIEIKTPTETYTQNVYLEKQKLVIIKDPIRQNTVIQKIDIPKETNLVNSMQKNPEIIILALLMGLATMLLGLFFVKRQYR